MERRLDLRRAAVLRVVEKKKKERERMRGLHGMREKKRGKRKKSKEKKENGRSRCTCKNSLLNFQTPISFVSNV
jgi:hypothetical protein